MTQLLSTSAAYVAARSKLGDHRKVFDSIGDALSTLRAIYATEGFPQEFPTVGAGIGVVDVTGEDTVPPLADWPEAYSTPGVLVCVSFIGVRGLETSDGKKANGARGFVVYPLHPVESIQTDESGIAWLWKVVEKEASHVALRGLRNVPDALGTDALSAAAAAMPLNVSDYVEESTRESLDTSAFDAIWKQFRKMLSDSPATAPLVPQLPAKSEVLKGIRSKSYATQEYESLEKIGAFVFIGQTMAGIIDHMRKAAMESGDDFEMDSDEIKTWLSQRETKTFTTPRKVESDLTKVNFAAFMAAPATEGEGASE